MSEKQLTVAELMARAGKEGSRPRRRRRSLEEGGVSVAELTGNIPKVNAKPVEGKHNSETIDGHKRPAFGESPEPAKTTEPAETTEPAKVAETPQVEAPEAPPAETPEEAAQPVAADPVAPQGLESEADTKAVKSEAVESEVVESTDTEVEANTEVEASTDEFAAQPKPSEDETVVLSVVQSDEPIRLTTKSDAAPSVTTSEAELAEPEEAGADTIIVVTPEQVEGLEPAVWSDEGDVEKPEKGASIWSVLLMAVVGIVLGLCIFKGFELLWAAMDRKIVAAIAVAVTALCVGFVHWLGTDRDKANMVLTAVVGLVITFGPLLLVI